MKFGKLIILLFSVLWLALLAMVQPAAAVGEFTLIVLPDTQIYSELPIRKSSPRRPNGSSDKKTPSTSSSWPTWAMWSILQTTTQYGNADAAMDLLDSGGVPYGTSPGNHDAGNLYNTYFGTVRYSGKSYLWWQSR